MGLIIKKITCPFCFETFYIQETVYRCINPLCPAKMEEDLVYTRGRSAKTKAPLGHIFQPHHESWISELFQNNRFARCDICSKESSKRLCPSCHFELSHDAGLIDDRIVAIIGGRETGKGHYIATLIHRLEQEVGSNFGFSLRMVGDETRKRFKDDYHDPLFQQKKILQATQSAVVDTIVKQPMLFRLTFRQGRKLRAVNLTFFDSAGEDMQSLDAMSTETRYICHASGIIFLLDPLQIEAIRQRVDRDILPKRDEGADPTYIVERLRELFERQLGLSATTKIKIPVAFVLSKIDTLLPILDPGSALLTTGEHFGGFDVTDSQSVHTEIWNYLNAWMGSGFTNRVETGFEKHHYFGVSSLGRSPDKTGKVETVSSIRVEDPFLWILYQLGLISKVRSARS